MSHGPLGELLPGIVGRMFAHDPAQEIAAARDGVADREGELVAEAGVVHRGGVLHLFSTGCDRPRWQGLAAPEWNEPGGTEALEAMIDLVEGQTVRCELDGMPTYDRCAGVCDLDGRDIAEMLVSAGLARDCPWYSGGRYAVIEAQAAADGATIRESYRLPGCCRRR